MTLSLEKIRHDSEPILTRRLIEECIYGTNNKNDSTTNKEFGDVILSARRARLAGSFDLLDIADVRVFTDAMTKIGTSNLGQDFSRVGYVELVNDYPRFAERAMVFLKEEPTHAKIFVNLIFPAVFNFFVSETTNRGATDFLGQVLKNTDEDLAEIRRGFVTTFFSCFIEFVEAFWKKFFEIVSAECGRFKASTRMVFNGLVNALKQTKEFMPQTAKTFLCILAGNIDQLCDYFIEGFLVRSFDVWAKSNPCISSKHVDKEMFCNLSLCMRRDPRGGMAALLEQSAKEEMESIVETLNVDEMIVPPSPIVIIVLSPLEQDIICKFIVNQFNVNVVAPFRNGSPPCSLIPAMIGQYRNVARVVKDVKGIHMMGEPQKPVEIANNLFLSQKFWALEVQCAAAKVAMIDVLCGYSGFDESVVRSQAKVTDELKNYCMHRLHNTNVQSAVDMKNFFSDREMAARMHDSQVKFREYTRCITDGLWERLEASRGTDINDVPRLRKVLEEDDDIKLAATVHEKFTESVKSLAAGVERHHEKWWADLAARVPEFCEISGCGRFHVLGRLAAIADQFSKHESETANRMLCMMLVMDNDPVRSLVLVTTLLRIAKAKTTVAQLNLHPADVLALDAIYAFVCFVVSNSGSISDARKATVKRYIGETE